MTKESIQVVEMITWLNHHFWFSKLTYLYQDTTDSIEIQLYYDSEKFNYTLLSGIDMIHLYDVTYAFGLKYHIVIENGLMPVMKISKNN